MYERERERERERHTHTHTHTKQNRKINLTPSRRSLTIENSWTNKEALVKSERNRLESKMSHMKDLKEVND